MNRLLNDQTRFELGNSNFDSYNSIYIYFLTQDFNELS